MANLLFLLPWLAGAAPQVGPFSHVGLDNLLDTTIVRVEAVAGGEGEQLLELGTCMQRGQRDGKTIVVTQEGFAISLRARLTPGPYRLTVEAAGVDGSTDSYYVLLNGKPIGGPLTIPIDTVAERAFEFHIAKPQEYTVGLVLRERPGSVLRSVRLGKVAIATDQPAMRPQLLGRHPRLLLTADSVGRLRRRIGDPRVRRFYRLPGNLRGKPPVFRPGERNGGGYRKLGSYALSYLLEPDERKLADLIRWLETATTYPHCGVDLDAEYFMEGIALCYDWLYDDLPEDLRNGLRQTIARQCRALFQASLAGRTGGGHAFQQNHFWFAHLALALGAAAVYGEEPEAELWLPWAWDRLERIALTFSPDGGFHEGVAYWDFSMPTLYLYIDLYEWCTGLRIPAADGGLAGQARFRLHHMFPGLVFSVPLEDSRIPQRRPPVKLLLWEAKRFRDPTVMGIAHALCSSPGSDRFNLLWLDESVPISDFPDSIPTVERYSDIETVFARSDWNADATCVAFVCRPMGGHKYAELCQRYGIGGTGHNHPEQNQFTIFGRGQFLAIDPGYTYEKRTRNHNTILVDGKGQYGDGQMWPEPNRGRAHITHFKTEGDVTVVVGDAASAYPPALGLKRFERTLVMIGRDTIVVYDRLAAEKPVTFSWLLHHQGVMTSSNRMWTIVRGDAQLCVEALLPKKLRAESTRNRPRYVHPVRDLTPEQPDINLLELTTDRTVESTFLVVLAIGAAGAKPPPARLLRTETCDVVNIGSLCVAFNRTGAAMLVPSASANLLNTRAKVAVVRGRHVVTVGD